MEKIKINLIPDEAINLIEKDLLGTSAYVETIKEIIENCSKEKERCSKEKCSNSYTIGLFGPWGSGKSSIIKTLQEEYNNDTNQSKIKVFIYDAWKYSKDDFRRTFILELRKSFGLDTKEDEELFYKDKVEDIQYKQKIDWYTFFKVFVIVFSISFPISLLFDFLNWSLFKNQFSILNNLFKSLSFAGLVSLLFDILKQSFIYYRVAITTPKLFAPEKFEERFKDTIDEIFGKKEIKESLLRRVLSKIFKFKTLTSESKKSEVEKLVIAIDNIDRCHKEQAFEILLTIKSFLGKEGVVFIIPIDDKGLKKHLQMSEQEANEFLRKLFNTSLQIRKFSDNELFDYGMQLVEKYGINIPEKENVISMITQEYSKNPRRIIQFLNTLQTEFYLAQVQEEKGYIPEGSITKNIKMLVKLLIIREEFPEIYEKIIDKPELIQEISEAISLKEFSKNEEGLWEYKMSDKQSLKEIKLTEEQYRFFMRTSNIVMDAIKLEPFFVNRDLFKDLPDGVYSLVISQDWEELKNMIESGQITLERLINYINDKLNEDVIKRGLYDTSGFNLLSLIFKIIYDKRQEIEDILQYINTINIGSVLENEKVCRNINKFPIEEFAFFLRWFKEKKGITPLNKELIKEFLNITISFANNFKDHKNWDIFNFWLEAMVGFIEKTKDEGVMENLFNFLKENWDYINSSLKNNQIEESHLKVYKSFLNVATELYLATDNPEQKQKIASLTIEILSNIKDKISQDKIKDIIELLSKIDESKLPEDDKQKLSNLKKDLEEKMKQKSIS